jgi:hypothetical protein
MLRFDPILVGANFWFTVLIFDCEKEKWEAQSESNDKSDILKGDNFGQYSEFKVFRLILMFGNQSSRHSSISRFLRCKSLNIVHFFRHHNPNDYLSMLKCQYSPSRE